MTSDQFYRLRDRRTVECGVASQIGEAPIRIVVGDDVAESPRGQLLVMSLVNQLARFHRRIQLRSPRKPLVARRALGPVECSANADLVDAAVALVSAIDPFARVELAPIGPCPASLGIGRCAPDAARWHVGSSGNIVRTGQAPVPADMRAGFSLGPCLAACVGAWALFRQVTDQHLTPIQVSAWNLRDGDSATMGPELLGPLDVGRCLVVGAGGVGSCLAYWLSQPGVVGEWLVVDKDHAELHNTNRSMGIIVRDTDWNGQQPKYKADLAAGLLPATPRVCWYADLARDEMRADLVLPLANERGVRTAISQRGDPILLHATTLRAGEAQLHRHLVSSDDCIICRMPRAESGPALQCAMMKVKKGDRSDDATLAFLSASAGLMLASGLYRLAAGEIQTDQFNCLRFLFHDGIGFARAGHWRCRSTCPGRPPERARAIAYGAGRWAQLDDSA